MAEGSSSRANLKRSFVEDDESNKQPAPKKVRFPKGKKVKQGDYVVEPGEEIPIPNWKDPRLAAKDRAAQRNMLTAELIDDENNNSAPDIRRAEVQYEENEVFVEEGIQIDPFNLDKEREDGYFDETGNYVEYLNRDEIKDAWLDNVDVEPKYAGKSTFPVSNDEKVPDLSTEELAVINRRITSVLEPGETVFQGLRRLKGSNDKKQKMSAETKQLFDQLTEDAMKLLNNGDYDVYEKKYEIFEREAEGYEKIVQARMHGLAENSVPEKADESFDMFGDDGSAANDDSSNVNVQPYSNEGLQNDYVYDESSGYYYSSSLGYYYDPSTGLYCCAASGKWYSYNEELGTYEEIPQQESNATATSVS